MNIKYTKIELARTPTEILLLQPYSLCIIHMLRLLKYTNTHCNITIKEYNPKTRNLVLKEVKILVGVNPNSKPKAKSSPT